MRILFDQGTPVPEITRRCLCGDGPTSELLQASEQDLDEDSI